jgi:large subunit ribosomal protein L13
MTRVNRKKIELDATGAAPGRIATQIASILIGKHKTHYVPYRDMGDKVVVKNADKVIFSGKKLVQKEYKHHSMHPGGLKVKPAATALREDPTFAIYHAVSKMLPRNKFRTDRLKRLSFAK